MQADIETAATAGNDSGTASIALLRYEINRLRASLDSHGETHALRERLAKLERLLEAGAATKPSVN